MAQNYYLRRNGASMKIFQRLRKKKNDCIKISILFAHHVFEIEKENNSNN